MHEIQVALVNMVFKYIRAQLMRGLTLNDIEKKLIKEGFINGEG